MRLRSLTIGLGVTLALAGCGVSASGRSPTLAGVPLTGGTRIIAHQTRCDQGANPYCAIQLVVVGRRYSSSQALLNSERTHLKRLGWGLVNADTADEHAAESPGHKLRLVFATAALDLKDVDLGWIHRSRTIALVLAQTMFDRVASLSLMLETGSS
jgi:hypothetical protein